MALATREDLRNVAIVAHVDHGKTTLVDAMLRQTNSFDAHAEVDDRVMDSNDLEREKGITILAKNTAISYEGEHAKNGPIVINVVDTPGHADFGGEVERALSMVDGVVLLVDASEGPLPQTRFVLRKALEAHLPVILAVNKTDRPDARIEEVEGEAQDLLLGLASDLSEDHPDIDVDAVLDVPTVYLSGRAGAASHERPGDGELPNNPDLEPLFETIIERVPAPSFDDEHPLQAHVTNLDSSPFLGRIALLRVHNGWIHKGETVAWVKQDGTVQNVRITELMLTKALTRYPAEKAGPGDIVAIAGIEDITIGETIADAEDVRPLPTITVDEPAISMTIGANTSPLVGKVKGHKLTARMIKDRLDRELIGNVSLRVLNTERPDAWEVQGRGELALAILVENMRREGFELTVGKPQVVTKQVDGKTHEPYEHLTIDTPEEHLGAITQLLAARKGRMENMVNNGTGWVRMEFIVPSRGLIGFRSEFMTTTRGTGIANAISHGYDEWAGPIVTRNNGSIVADRAGVVTPFSLINLQERMTFFVQPTAEVYEGMVIGENSRSEDMDVNITKEKKLTNMRSSTADSFESMTPPRVLTLEECLEFAREDECVEVTPEVVRIRKVELEASLRARAASRLKQQLAK
ncbi:MULTISPECIES: translational GTPase TypA [Leucobacter]|uniref:Large ribosomal subunit assembly factor BipA n=1 Tax=Leucobacter iarius TaxID=333963 RepID=A0ABN2LRX7_9MICO|nr:translational GTPase TypA [Leucobacter sp. Ag1]KKI18978.1 GTP-binding protein TypA [Leucobacter sp. Ag1]